MENDKYCNKCKYNDSGFTAMTPLNCFNRWYFAVSLQTRCGSFDNWDIEKFLREVCPFNLERTIDEQNIE